jgi:AcrR family transcriptional regulator
MSNTPTQPVASPGQEPLGRRERKKREKRERILAAARALFEEQGFDGTTGRQICERAGIATGTLFLYVKDKRELLLWVFADDARRIFARAGRAEGPPIERWLALFGPFIRLYARHPALSAAYVKELLFRPDRPPELLRLNQELRDAARAIAEDGQSDGVLRPDVDANEIAQMVVGQYAHLVQLWLGVGAIGPRQVRARLERGLTLLIEGVGA